VIVKRGQVIEDHLAGPCLIVHRTTRYTARASKTISAASPVNAARLQSR
jgi:hypothetical protein